MNRYTLYCDRHPLTKSLEILSEINSTILGSHKLGTVENGIHEREREWEEANKDVHTIKQKRSEKENTIETYMIGGFWNRKEEEERESRNDQRERICACI